MGNYLSATTNGAAQGGPAVPGPAAASADGPGHAGPQGGQVGSPPATSTTAASAASLAAVGHTATATPNAPLPMPQIRFVGGPVFPEPQTERIRAAPFASRAPSTPAVTDSPSFLSFFLPARQENYTHSHVGSSLQDIRRMEALLCRILARKGVPPEVVRQILRHMDYESACRVIVKKQLTVVTGQGPVRRGEGNGMMWFLNGMEEEPDIQQGMHQEDGLVDRDGEVWYMASAPVGCTKDEPLPLASTDQRGDDGDASEKRPKSWQLDKVVIETLSRDQGWSSSAPAAYGTYEHSYSWFEVSLLRDGKEVPGTRTSIQNNVHAGQYFKAHMNTLDSSHPLVQQVIEGDRILLWARAQFPGWRNVVREAAITLHCSPHLP